MSAFDTIANQAASVFNTVFGRSVTYTRDGSSETVTAIAHDEERPVMFEDAQSLRIFDKIWRIKVSDLPFGLPQRYDEITDTNGTWRVLPIADNEPEWRYADDTRTEVVITTKEVPAGS